MEQKERRVYLIERLLEEEPQYRKMAIPHDEQGQKNLLRSLMNVRMPREVSEEFLTVQDAYLRETIAERGVTRLEELESVEGELYLWQGDITTLACDAIVNAANAQMLGCFVPLHNCIDNCIHTYAGVQLRSRCAELMEAQGFEEPTGQAKITPGYNLPCKYILHTVGPIVTGPLTQVHKRQLASCYKSCLELAGEYGCESVAFCCLSTGVFMFPKDKAAQIAVLTVREYLNTHPDTPVKKVIFNVFTDEDYQLYDSILNKHITETVRKL